MKLRTNPINSLPNQKMINHKPLVSFCSDKIDLFVDADLESKMGDTVVNQRIPMAKAILPISEGTFGEGPIMGMAFSIVESLLFFESCLRGSF